MSSRLGYAVARNESGRAAVGGCGRTGAEIAKALGDQGYLVHILDRAAEAFDRLPEARGASGRVQPVVADITLESHLRAANVHEADIFVAVAGSDATNALSAQIAHHILMVPVVVCRLDDPVKRDLYEKLELRAVSQVNLSRDMVMQRLLG